MRTSGNKKWNCASEGDRKGMKKVREEEFDLDAVMAKVRLDVSARRRASGPDPKRSSPPRRISAWVSIGDHLNVAEGQAQAVSMISPMTHRHWLVRPFARMLSRLVLFLTKFQTIPQARCNESVIQALSKVDSNGTRLSGRQSSLEYRLEAFVMDLRILEHELKAAGDRLDQSVVGMRDAISTQAEKLEAVENRTHKTQTALEQALPSPEVLEEGKKLLEASYLSFENLFRGTREDIIERQRVYLPFVQSAITSREEDLVLDLGCGRGEWLELVREAGLKGRGVDTNAGMVQLCTSSGFDVVEAKVLPYLKSFPEESVKVITGFHLIEHMPFEQLLVLIETCHRALPPGGLLIFETPNPENLLVGSHTFWQDPTHLKPLPSSLVTFFLERAGFEIVKVLEVSSLGIDSRLEGSPVGEVVAERLGGSQDYGVVASKAGLNSPDDIESA